MGLLGLGLIMTMSNKNLFPQEADRLGHYRSFNTCQY